MLVAKIHEFAVCEGHQVGKGRASVGKAEAFAQHGLFCF